MSGIVGIVSHENAPVDRSLLERMTASLAYRGPDRTGLWYSEDAGFGHTLLATTFEAQAEQQPCTLDGRVFITADCRVDGREDLRAKLEARGRRGVHKSNDPELILHSYHVWGDECVGHLIGDFAFAIWDTERRRLFCARDQNGVKLFYYTTKPGGVIFSNTLNCLRLHPAVSDNLDDLAFLDFLVFGENQDLSTTTFADLKSIPPAHRLVWAHGHLTVSRYWHRPVDEPIHFRRSHDYVDCFEKLLDTAIRDRLRTSSAAVQMSGGLDSTLIAARIKRIAPPDFRLSAHTVYWETLFFHEERHYAQIAASHLRIPIHLLRADDYLPYHGDSAVAARYPEPDVPYYFQRQFDLHCQMGARARVNFYGEGPDNLLLYEWKPFLSYLRQNRRYFRMLRAVVESLCLDPRVPFAFWARRPKLDPYFCSPELPDWLRPEMMARYRLDERWQGRQSFCSSANPFHPVADSTLSAPWWHQMFAHDDPGVTGLPLETRHPFFDLRLSRFLLALPVIPWCRRKLILRRAAVAVLPPEIWRREKSPIDGDILLAHHRSSAFASAALPPIEGFSKYVTKWPSIATNSSDALLASLRPFGLNLWARTNR